MNKLPNMIQGLLEKYGSCKIVRHKYDVPSNQLRTDMKAFHGVCVVVRTKEGKFVLIRHRFVYPALVLTYGLYLVEKWKRMNLLRKQL